jgi:glycosyltransferase involved in cell wall biosynthesis
VNPISVIIPAARLRLISDIVDALCFQGRDLIRDIIIVHNEEQTPIACDQKRVRCIPVPRSMNAPTRRNKGMDIAQGDIFLFLDDDCVPLPGLLTWHHRCHQEDRPVVGGAVTFPATPYLQAADNVSAFHDLLSSTPAGTRDYLCTSNLSVRRSVVEHAGLMNEELARADDLEWTVRFRTYGYSLYFEPRARVRHDPPRNTWFSLWQHWIGDAPDTIRVRLRYADLLDTPRAASHRGMFLWASPLIAMWATLRTFRGRHARRCYKHTLPVVYLTKLVWCWSAYQNFPNLEMGR